MGTITCAHQWVLTKGTDGRLVATTFNYETGLSEGYRVSGDPGSSVHFSINPALAPGQVVAIGDTLGSLYSSEIQERLIALNGQLAAARSALAVNASGQKEAIVNEAEQRLAFAQRRHNEQQAILARSRKLFSAGLISQEEHEAVETENNRRMDEITIAEANLEAARTGAKPEQIELSQAHIVALETEIEALKKRAATYTLTAPISGQIFPTFSDNTLLMISDPTKYVALVAVKASDCARISATRTPELVMQGFSKTIRGTVVAVGREAETLQGQNVVIATALLSGCPQDVMPGMLAKCRIECTRTTAAEWLKRTATAVVQSRSM